MPPELRACIQELQEELTCQEQYANNVVGNWLLWESLVLTCTESFKDMLHQLLSSKVGSKVKHLANVAVRKGVKHYQQKKGSLLNIKISGLFSRPNSVVQHFRQLMS